MSSIHKTNNKVIKKRQKYLQDTYSVASFSTQESSDTVWLPPFASLLLPPSPSTAYIYPEIILTHHRQVHMPMIPYFFHHKQFGIEACMLQLMQAKPKRYHQSIFP